jgi:serine/threonine protein kinase
MQEDFRLQPGTVLADKFTVLEYMSQGSLGEDIYLGEQAQLERKVVIKILPPTTAHDSEYVERFKQSIKLTATLQHPNILAAYEAGEENGRLFMVIAQEEGFFLNEYLRQRGHLEQNEAIKLLLQVIDALDYAWENFKILHRNLTPETILIARGNKPMLTDMGLAKSAESVDASLTMAGYAIGNPQYMSPEQVKAEDLDFRSDIYCLGLIFYEMLTGKPAFSAQNHVELMEAQVNIYPASLEDENQEVSKSCCAIVKKMIAKIPADRYQSWQTLKKDLTAILKGQKPPSFKAKGTSKKITQKRGAVVISGNKKNTDKPDLAALDKAVAKNTHKSKTPLLIALVLVILIAGGAYYVYTEKPELLKNIGLDIQTETANNEDIQVQSGNNAEKPVKPVKNEPEKPKTSVDDIAKKQWKQVQEYVKRNSRDHDKVIAKYKEAMVNFAGTKYERMAEFEVKKWENAKVDYQKKMEELKIQRQKQQAEQRLAQQKALEERENEVKKEELLKKLADLIIKGKFHQALEDYNKSPSKNLIPEAEDILKSLENTNKTIVESFKGDIGKTITLKINGKKEAVKIKNIKGLYIYIEQKVGKATFIKKISCHSLSISDKLARLKKSGFSKFALAIYAGLDALKHKRYDEAEVCFEDAGVFSKPLAKAVSAIKRSA